MAAKMLSALVLMVAVVTQSPILNAATVPISAVGLCKETAIEHISLSTMCEEILTFPYVSRNAADIDCAFGAIVCNNDGSINFNSYIIRSGVLNLTISSTISNIQGANQGVLLRTYTNPVSGTTKGAILYMKSLTEFQPNDQGKRNIKLSYVLCDPATGTVFNKVIGTNYRGTHANEVRSLLSSYEEAPIGSIANTCHPEDYLES